MIPETATPAEAQRLATDLGLSPLLGTLLVSRGITTPQVARSYLNPGFADLHDPGLLPDIEPAVERLARAVADGEPILVHGDYDADGVCSAALFTRVLTRLGARVQPFVPHRQRSGYDLQSDTVDEVARQGIRLIVTVDCGVAALDAVARAREVGVDVVVTDHHQPRPDGRLPAAVAIVDPLREGSRYPFPYICGTAVAYKVCWALAERMGKLTEGFRRNFLDLVAIATVTDCMPLRDENRALVSLGLEVLRNTRKAGLKALFKTARVSGPVTSRTLGFTIGPRLNAVGRVDDAALALRLLLTEDAQEAAALADQLEKANECRQAEQERILQSAQVQVERRMDDPVLVLASPNWHMGIIGIVAGKIAETCSRPSVLISIDEEAGRARGSCRSPLGFDIFGAIDRCRHLLLRCGGHRAAAGFDMEPGKIDEFRQVLCEIGAREIDPDSMTPTIQVHAELSPDDLGIELARELARLEPYGNDNPEPVLLSRRLCVQNRLVRDNRIAAAPAHLFLKVKHPRLKAGLSAVMWRGESRQDDCPAGSLIDACYRLEIHREREFESPQLNLEDLSPAPVETGGLFTAPA